MTMSVEDLDRELHEYGKTAERDTKKVEATTTTDSLQFAVKKIDDIDAQAYLFDAALQFFPPQSAEFAGALSQLTSVMQKAADRVVVQRALAYGYYLKGDLENSIEHARTAIKLEDADPEMQLLAAYAINGGNADAIRLDSAYPKLTPYLTAALRMNGDYAPAHNMLGLAMLSDGKAEQGAQEIGRAAALRPANPVYLLSLAQAQDAVGNFDAARTLLSMLKNSDDPKIAERATQTLATVGRIQKQKSQWEEMGISASTYKDPTDPRWKPKEGAAAKSNEAVKEPAKFDTRKTEYLKGTLVSVDCSNDPAAVLSVKVAGKLWKFNIPDRKTVLLINPDRFSCAWRDQEVSVNYKPSGTNSGDVVSLSVD